MKKRSFKIEEIIDLAKYEFLEIFKNKTKQLCNEEKKKTILLPINKF